MSDEFGPKFVDLHSAPVTPGPSRGDDDDDDLEPGWKRAWRGKEMLWRVFWFYFVSAHGIAIALGGGTLVITLVVGLVVVPESMVGGFWGLAVGIVAVGAVVLPYTIWCAVALWRCAYNCEDTRWGNAARVFIVSYLGFWTVFGARWLDV